MKLIPDLLYSVIVNILVLFFILRVYFIDTLALFTRPTIHLQHVFTKVVFRYSGALALSHKAFLVYIQITRSNGKTHPIFVHQMLFALIHTTPLMDNQIDLI